jgi:hypothetical protein
MRVIAGPLEAEVSDLRERLEALPFARHCIDCQRVIEEEERMATG